MKGAALVSHGGPESLVWREDLPEPAPAPGEVVVQVSACGINHLDIWIRKGLKGVVLPLPHVLGADVCGTVASVGAGVSSPKAGDRVLVNPGLPCGTCARCAAGRESECPQFGILGLKRWGGYAERVVVPAANCLSWPEGMAAPLAAAVPLVFTTAHHMLHARGQLKAGETVLVLAASSGVGTAAVQLAKAAGARVLAVVGSEDKAFRVLGLDADRALVRTAEDFVAAALRETEGRGVDLIVDPVGGEVLAKALGALDRGGRLVTCAVTAGPAATLDLRTLYMRHLSVLGAYMGSRHELEAALALLASGRVKPVVDTVFPMREAAEAHRRLEEGRHFGKLVLTAT